MQGGDGDPFGGFRGSGGFRGFGGHGGPPSLISNFFGGRDPFNDHFFRDPFNDPFFTRPFGGMLQSSLFGPSMNPFAEMQPPGFIQYQQPESRRSHAPIIEEIHTDDEEEEDNRENKLGKRKRSSSESDPRDAEVEEIRNTRIQCVNDNGRVNRRQLQPQTRSYSFQSSTVTCGSCNGAYYTSSQTRRTGSNGLTIEEVKEANSATREAAHRVSRGFHNKGHTVARNFNSDGKVDTTQTLHNLDEDELLEFEQSWSRNAGRNLTGAQSMAIPSIIPRIGAGPSRGQAGSSRRARARLNAGERDDDPRDYGGN